MVSLWGLKMGSPQQEVNHGHECGEISTWTFCDDICEAIGDCSGGKVGRGAENKVQFITAVQTTPDGKPQFMCLRQQPFTNEEVAVFAASSFAPTATVVSDGLWCFGAVQIVGARHERVVTGDGEASADPPQLRAINTVLGNLKTALIGTISARMRRTAE